MRTRPRVAGRAARLVAGLALLPGGAACAGGASPDAMPAVSQQREAAATSDDGEGPSVAGSQEDEWARRIAPFPVLDEDGEPYDFAFLGGFNVPRPQYVDIDGDGDLDLFVQERSNELIFFENRSEAEATRDAERSENRSEAEADEGDADSHAASRFVWRTDTFAGLDVHEWYRFVDMDGDGDPDLLTEQPLSLIRYLRNRSDEVDGAFSGERWWAGEAAGGGERLFVEAVDTLRDTEGETIYSDRQNIPNVTDIDCDGRPDLFLGRLEGTITRYEATAEVGDALPAFELVTERFEGIEIVAEVMIGSLRHGANSMVFADVEGDGDEDLFWGDFFEPGLLLIENRSATGSAGDRDDSGDVGTCGEPALQQSEPEPFPFDDPIQTSGFNVPAVGDVDGDGEYEVLVGVLGGAYNPNRTAADNLYYLDRDADGYTLETRRYLPQIDLGAETAIALGDIDDDGDTDMLAAASLDPDDLNTSRIVVFENRGGAEAAPDAERAGNRSEAEATRDAQRSENTASSDSPSFHLADTLDIGGAYHFAPELADLDGDGDLDLLLGSWNDGVLIAWNEGDARAPDWVLDDEPLVTLTRGSHTVPAANDIDGDGDLDLIVGEAVGALNLYENVGGPESPRFELVSDEYGGFDVGRRSAPTFTDLDGDGRADLVVGSEAGGPECFRNVGGEFEAMADCPLPDLHPNSVPAFADVDGDGVSELLAGTLGGGVVYFERRAR